MDAREDNGAVEASAGEPNSPGTNREHGEGVNPGGRARRAPPSQAQVAPGLHVEGRETSEAEAAAQSRPAFAPIAFPQMDTYSPTSVVVLSTDLDGSLSGSTSGSGRLSRFASRFTFNPVVRRGPVSATMPVSIERDYDIGTSASAGNRIEEIVTEVQVSRVEPIEEQPQAGTEGAGEGGEPVVCVVPVVTAIPQELPGVTGAGGGEDGVVPVMAVPNYDPDHILTLTPDEIRLYWVWKTGKRILWLTLLSMCLTAFWILKFRQAFTLLLIPLLGYYAARGYSMVVSCVYAIAQLLPILARGYVLATYSRGGLEAGVATLYVVSMAVEVMLFLLAVKFVFQLRKCTSMEVRLLQSVYHYTFRAVERESEGFWSC